VTTSNHKISGSSLEYSYNFHVEKFELSGCVLRQTHLKSNPMIKSIVQIKLNSKNIKQITSEIKTETKENKNNEKLS
jgi:hypothetical protein